MAESTVRCENLEAHNAEEDGLSQKAETSNTNSTVCCICIQADGNGNDDAAAADASDLNQMVKNESVVYSYALGIL